MTKKSKIMTVAIIGLITLVVYKFWSRQWDVGWITRSPTDIVQVGPDTFRLRGSTAKELGIQLTPTPTIQAEPLEGTVTITGKAWEHAPSKSCFTSGKWINAYIVTPGIHWQVQFDNDPKRVFDLYPKDWKTNSVLVVTNTHNLQRWRVNPKYHDRDTVATVVWRIESVQAE